MPDQSAQADGGATQQFAPVNFRARRAPPWCFLGVLPSKKTSPCESHVHGSSAAIKTSSVFYSRLLL